MAGFFNRVQRCDRVFKRCLHAGLHGGENPQPLGFQIFRIVLLRQLPLHQIQEGWMW